MPSDVTEVATRPKTAPVTVDFRQVYADESAFVWRAVRRLGGRDAELEDLVHDVFAAAYRSWSTLDGTRPLRPWLYGVTYRVMLDHHRKHSTHRELPTEAVVDQPDERRGPLEETETRQGLTLAQEIINGLELDRRVIFVMHELEGLGMPEIAQTLDLPLNTAYSRLRLARRDFEAAAESRRARDGA